MRGTQLLAICLAASFTLAACGSTGGSGAVVLKASADRPDARVTVAADAQQAVVEVFSPSGIGSAEVVITSAARPQKIVLRLHLRGLEQLRFTYGDATVTASLSSTGDSATQQTYRGDGQEQAIVEGSPYWMSIRLVPAGGSPATIPLENGYIEVEAPQDFLANRKTKFAIQWIDFYR
jgi:hypothetical protein